MRDLDKKLCFVIMGFGVKKDPVTNRTINLDETYTKIIQPAVNASGYTCVRADEILESGLIDRSMFALLYKAELVIADISTHNANALYELGVRHAFKPFSTIVIKENKTSIPFDIQKNRILSYEHLGNEITSKEAKKNVRDLKALIMQIAINEIIDSPIYSLIQNIKPPNLSDEEIKLLIGELKDNENTIFYLTEKAKRLMKDNEFEDAAKVWSQLNERVKNDIYYIQQEALCTYKSKKPNIVTALIKAQETICKLSEHNDSETLGITGAIYKRLWKSTKQESYLHLAIETYGKGWASFKDYYTGENYANCLEQKAPLIEDEEEKIYNKVEARKTRESIIEIILDSLKEEEPEELKWKYATLSNCYLAIGNETKAKEFHTLFLKEVSADWEIKTFEETRNDIIKFKQQ